MTAPGRGLFSWTASWRKTFTKGKNTHIIVERIVADIDEIVKKVRFPDWQHTDQELFDKAYGYIRQYY